MATMAQLMGFMGLPNTGNRRTGRLPRRGTLNISGILPRNPINTGIHMTNPPASTPGIHPPATLGSFTPHVAGGPATLAHPFVPTPGATRGAAAPGMTPHYGGPAIPGSQAPVSGVSTPPAHPDPNAATVPGFLSPTGAGAQDPQWNQEGGYHGNVDAFTPEMHTWLSTITPGSAQYNALPPLMKAWIDAYHSQGATSTPPVTTPPPATPGPRTGGVVPTHPGAAAPSPVSYRPGDDPYDTPHSSQFPRIANTSTVTAGSRGGAPSYNNQPQGSGHNQPGHADSPSVRASRMKRLIRIARNRPRSYIGGF